ncbi:MAG TPA: FGGY family carbohydrate kinase [Rectinema sp.]|nr:FGGY family carbohydrate kinase [Rectinema sp.]HOM91793.1 FGGY family carbohydrate kinase [Rectinema sp.]HRT38420.1 FGGY family carbohydrate kinase [Rectinema sp.]HRU03062.1 FGGY family carbohydrate kinase [Rectinema sp.]
MILAIDIGTTRIKAALFDSEGNSLKLELLDLPDEGSNSYQEIDARVWLKAFSEIISRLISAGEQNDLRAIVICGNGPTILPIDEKGEPIAPAITWLDRRAQKEAKEASIALNYSLDAAFNLPKILWMKRQTPNIYEKANLFVSCPEFIAGRLTGEWTTCLPNQGYKRIIWDRRALEMLELDVEKFPRFIGVGEIVGHIHDYAAKEFGLPKGLPVVMAGPDFIASLLGTATVKPGRTCDKAGTSEGINLCSERDIGDVEALLVMPHIIVPYFNISGVISSSGIALSWFRSRFLPKEDFETIYSRVASTKPGAEGLVFLPYLAGERSPHWDPNARAVFLGLGLHHDLNMMARAVLEGTAFAIREVLDVMESSGASVKDMRATGTPSLSPVWNQIKADITRKRLMVSSFPEPELAGCLAIGRFALGEESTLTEAAERVFIPAEIFEPRNDTESMYCDLYEVYIDSYRRLADLFPAISGLQKNAIVQQGPFGKGF